MHSAFCLLMTYCSMQSSLYSCSFCISCAISSISFFRFFLLINPMHSNKIPKRLTYTYKTYQYYRHADDKAEIHQKSVQFHISLFDFRIIRFENLFCYWLRNIKRLYRCTLAERLCFTIAHALDRCAYRCGFLSFSINSCSQMFTAN